MAITVDHIRDVSFKQYFLSDTGETPANGKIKVHDNTYEVSFANGQVNARFTSGNGLPTCSAGRRWTASRTRCRPSTTTG